MHFIKYILEFQKKENILKVCEKHRGIYVLYQQEGKLSNKKDRFDVVYIGRADRNIAKRLREHEGSRRKKWSHFSAYVVWSNITREEICELEGLFRYIYRRDGFANIFNRQRGHKDFQKISTKNVRKWPTLMKKIDSA